MTMIEKGVYNNFNVSIKSIEYDFSHLKNKLNSHIHEVVQSIMRSIGTVDDIDVILLVGGGATYYEDVLRELLDHPKIIVREDALYSNAKGFLQAGLQRVGTQ